MSSPFLTVPPLNHTFANQQLQAAAMVQQQRAQMQQFEQQQLAYFSRPPPMSPDHHFQRGTSAVQVLAEEGFATTLPGAPLIPRNYISSGSVEGGGFTFSSSSSSFSARNVADVAAASEAAVTGSQKKIFAALDLLRKTPVPAAAAAATPPPAAAALFASRHSSKQRHASPNASELEEQIVMAASPLHAASLAINVARSAEAQRAKLCEFERTLDEAQRLNLIEQRLTDHQNDHTKLRAQRLLDVDRARWEVSRCEFRAVEVQAQMEAAIVALQERLLSRVATLKQLQEDSVRQSEHRLRSDIRGQHDRHIVHFREHISQRTATVESLSVALQQLAAHVEVQCASLEHDLVANSNRSNNTHAGGGGRAGGGRSNSMSGATGRVSAAMDKLVSIRHSLTANNQRATAAVESMVSMLDAFATDVKRQLGELAAERAAFNERMARRIEEMRASKLAADAKNSRAANRAAATGGRGPSL